MRGAERGKIENNSNENNGDEKIALAMARSVQIEFAMLK